jgi:predicted metal-binding protein
MVDILKYTRFFIKEIDKSTLFFDERVGEWCQKKYPGNPKGCKNYGNSILCPPKSPFLKKEILSYPYHILFCALIDFKGYKKEMSERSSKYTDKQNACCYYYQGSLKKHFYNFVMDHCKYNYPCDLLLGCGHGFGPYNEKYSEAQNAIEGKYKIYAMEAVGINVVKTVRHNELEMVFPPKDQILFCSLLCSDRNLKEHIHIQLPKQKQLTL